MPALSRMGYRYEEAMQLPAWRFWALVKADNKDVTRRQTLDYESVALSFGSFEKATSKEIHRRWRETLSAGYEKAPLTKEERRKDWAEIGKWLN